MIFLIQYNRREGQTRRIDIFEDAQRSIAEANRLEMELSGSLNGDEVVILEADSEADLRRSHQRYFATLSELLRNAAEEVATAAKK